MRFIYPAVIKEQEDGTYTASFPDLMMCEAKGNSMMHVVREATEAAYNWIDLEMQEDDPQLPPASDPEDLILLEGETVKNILVIYRMHQGWDE